MRNAGALLARPTAARPGPGAMPGGLLRALDVSIGRRVEGLLAGDFRSNLLGTGTELAMMRPYVPGDDVRRIDWNVTARTGEPHVRVDLAERVLVTWLVLDTSVSMRSARPIGGRPTSPRASRSRSATSRRGAETGSGVVTFGGGEPRGITAAAGTSGPRRDCSPRFGASRPRRAGARCSRCCAPQTGALARQRSLVVVVSDFRGARDWRRALLGLAGHHDVVAVEIRDPREQELADVGLLWLVDPETGRQLRVDTRSAGCASGSPWPPPAERAALAGRSRRRRPARGAHDSGDWLRPLVTFLRRSRS